MRTYVSTLGYHGERVTRPVIGHGLDAGDEVVFVRPGGDADDGRAKEAINHVRRLLQEVEPAVSISVECIDTEPFERAVLQCSALVRRASGDVVVNLGGGAREVFLPLSIAAVLQASRIETGLQYRDVDERVREWEVPDLTASVPESAWFVLDLLAEANGKATVPELTRRSERSKSTITRWINELDEAGLVETDRTGKTKIARTSTTARLLLEAREGRT